MTIKRTHEQFTQALEGWSDENEDLHQKISKQAWNGMTKNAGEHRPADTPIAVRLEPEEVTQFERWERENAEFLEIVVGTSQP